MPQLPRVEKAWLEAAKNGDVDQMKTLRKWYPQWLNLSRTVDEDTATNDSDGFLPSRSPGFCSWDGFHLRTVGASALHTATWHSDNKIVQYLLEEGQDPDTEDESGMTAIVLAIMHHNLQATRCVYRERVAIQRNLAMDCQRGKTALHHATTDDANGRLHYTIAYNRQVYW
ncbi:uncharacterized protein PITG_15361 [Phytophthora infestans T30-4]|uniref:Uncharacterized protein n=1 Tax=Phytophthora infestans (strain T30-4) TaxID=403677 RepID=D0NR28_PHYIT|nr:uncharacterized protein PITG_15361 [Phytophthora infestans T30-4]EEY63150.1 conserved hypothetical protein [Phytophthora infestans T30-4]|eukprot:XP_002898327.1 conserved hypothetical protein [Phytophthora infestans T30-4]